MSKRIKDIIDGVYDPRAAHKELKAAQAEAGYGAMSEVDLSKEIRRLEKEMLEHARNLEFEQAAQIRDRLRGLKEKLFGVAAGELPDASERSTARCPGAQAHRRCEVTTVKVLFVCTGNICRSPTAAGVFRQQVKAAGLARRIHADSAGMLDYHTGEPPDPRAQAAAKKRKYDLSRLRARQVRPEDFHEYDHLLAMDAGHLAQLRRLGPVEHRAQGAPVPGVRAAPGPS